MVDGKKGIPNPLVRHPGWWFGWWLAHV